ncbi:hypothetical protein RHSIM_Rhsim08G0171600 [Rhododendron simsii]|uniref:Carbonic anhydrase n=1 Tax=Rhododendron simsii TaxID=118357 RepID=A0A834GNB9_RHOSS|nr:hypothetical protein RHSIM_Rhsim08G0171600 [Rhododendron simsii]
MAGKTSSHEVAAEGIKRLLRNEEDETKVETTETALRRIDVGDPIVMIKRGFHHFMTDEFRKFPEYFEHLAAGQNPKFLVFACSDSRVCPSRVLDFRPGQAFMSRNIANLVPGFDQRRHSESGAVIEYAVAALKVEVILVIGHSKCGGIEALMSLTDDAPPSYDFVHDWIKIGLPAKAKVMADHGDEPFDGQCRMCEKVTPFVCLVEAVNVSLINLLTYPYVRSRVAEGTLKLMGGHYDFVDGKLQVWGFNAGTKPLLCI